MLVVGDGQTQDIGLGIDDHRILHNDGGGVIDDEGHFQSIGLGPVAVIELHQSGETKQTTLTLGHIGGEVQLEGLGHIQPAAQSRIVVGRIDDAALLVEQLLAGGGVGDHGPVGTGVADQTEVKAPEIVAALEVDGVSLGHITAVGGDGVAAEVVGHIGIIAVGDAHTVDIGGCPVGLAVLFTGEIGGVAGLVEHGGLVPAAVVGQHGDAQGGQEHALVICHSLGGDESLDIRTGGVLVVQTLLLPIGQPDGDLHGDGFVGTDFQCGTALLQQQVDIVGVDQTIAVQVGVQALAGGHGVQQELRIRLVGLAVVVEIIGAQISCGFQNFAVDPELNFSVQGTGQRVQIPDSLLALEDILGEGVAGEDVGNGLVGQVIQVECEAVNAGAVGIVAQLGLDLTIVLTLHGDVDGGGHGVGHIGEAGALLHDGVVAAVDAVDESLGGAHEQGLGQGTIGHALDPDAVLLQILEHQGGHTRHLGCGHGGAGHELIAGTGGIHAVDGVDVAAGGSDLGLQHQIAGNTPGGEAADGLELGIVIVAGDGTNDLDRSNIVGHAALASLLLAALDDIGSIGLGDGHHGDGVLQAGQIHVDHAGLVVVDHNSHCAQGGGVVGLLQEGQLAAGDEDDLAGQIDAVIVLGMTVAVQEDKAVIGAGCLQRGIQGGQRHVAVLHIAVAQGFQIAEGMLTHGQIAGEIAVVVHGGHSQGIGVGAGGAAGGEVHIIVEEVAVVGVLGPVAVVAAGDGHDGISLLQLLEQLLVQGIIAVSSACQGGAQGQVDGICAKDQSILHGGENVGVISAAVVAEDLHGQDLGIGSIARHAGLPGGIHEAVVLGNEAVCGGNTGNMGAVLALAVIVVGDVQIGVDVVVAESGLGVDVQVLSSQGHAIVQLTVVGVQLGQNLGNVTCVHQLIGLAGGCGCLLHGVAERLLGEGLMIGVEAGVDDGNTHTRAGIARQPGLLCAGHLAGNGHLRLIGTADGGDLGLVAVLLHHTAHTVQLLDLGDGGAGHIGGDDVCGQGQIPHHIQLPALQDLALDGCDHGLLAAPEAVPVAYRSSVRQAALHQETGVHGGSLLQLNGYTDHFVHVCFRLGSVLHLRQRQSGGDGIIADLLDAEAQLGIVLHRLHRGHISRHQHKCQQQRQSSAKKVALFHILSS